MKKKYIIVLSIIFLFWLFFSINAAYAFFMVKNSQDSFNIVKSECFKLSFEDNNAIYLNSVIPITDEEASSLKPYEFTIKNVCNKAAQYNVNIEELGNSTLDDDFVKFRLDNEESELLSNQDINTVIVNDKAVESRTIDSAILLPDEERTYNLRLWLDENSTVEAADKIFESKIVIVAAIKKNPFVEVTFDSNGGILEKDIVSYVEGRKFHNLPVPVKKGFVFLGWYLNPQLNDESGVSNSTIVDASISKLYAKYTENTFKLSIDPNGGEYNFSPGIYEANVTYKNSYELGIPSKEGYTFTNWNVESGDETTIDGNVVTMGLEDSVVKANWKINSYNLTVKLNDGSADNTYQMDYHSTKEIPNPVRDGYTFIGWSVSSGVLDSTTFTIDASDAVLSANWQVNDYKWVVYHNKMNVSGSGYTLADTENGHGNYGTVFKGTLKNYVGFTNPIQTSGTILEDVKYGNNGTPTNNVLNYNYVRNKYSVVVNPNGGSYSSSSNSTTHSNIYYQGTYTINNPSRTGYNFSGWTVSGNGSSVSGTTFTMGNENASLVAKWTAKTYTLTLNNQSATSAGSTSVVATYDSSIPKITIPSRTEYIFEGYYTGTNGSGTKYINADGTSARTWNLDKNTTLYAKWRKEYVDITFDFRGSNNAFNHLGYSLVQKSGNYYNIKKANQVVSTINIPATYTYNNQKYRITNIGGSHGTISNHIVDLSSVTIPNTIKNIGVSAFQNVDNMQSFSIPTTVTSIGDYAFYGSGLTKIVIPTSIKSIGVSAFEESKSLQYIYIEPTNITFGKRCFYYMRLGTDGDFGTWIYTRNDSIMKTLHDTNFTSTGGVYKSDYVIQEVSSIEYGYYVNFYPMHNWTV